MKQQHRLSKKQRHVLKLLAERPRHRLEPEMWGWVAVEDLRDPFLGERPDGRYSSAEMLSAVRSARRSVAALAQQGLVITEARYFGWDPAKEEGSGAASSAPYCHGRKTTRTGNGTRSIICGAVPLAIAEASPAGCSTSVFVHLANGDAELLQQLPDFGELLLAIQAADRRDIGSARSGEVRLECRGGQRHNRAGS